MISVYFCSLCWVPLYFNIYIFKFRIWITNHPPFKKNPQKFFEEIILKFYTLPFYSSFRGLLHHYYLRLKDFCFKNLCTKQALQEVSSFYLCNVSWWLILFYQCNSSDRVIDIILSKLHIRVIDYQCNSKTIFQNTKCQIHIIFQNNNIYI